MNKMKTEIKPKVARPECPIGQSASFGCEHMGIDGACLHDYDSGNPRECPLPMTLVAEGDDERGIITISAPCDADSLTKFLKLAIEVAEVKYPVDAGWSRPIVETRSNGWYVYVYIQTREIEEASDA